jgi:N-acyl homoserine lactone hydrolase
MAEYSIWLVQTGVMPEVPVSGHFYGAHNEGTMAAPLGFVVVRGEGHVVLVDVGFRVRDDGSEVRERYGVHRARSSHVALTDLGIAPGEVDTILLTHAHWDHMGNLDAFPNATIYLQSEELRRWRWALALPERMAHLRTGVEADDFRALSERMEAGDVRLVEGRVDGVLPGIDLVPAFDTHTYGSQFVVITTTNADDPGPWVAAGDCVFSFRNLEGLDRSGTYVPLGQGTGSPQRMLETFEEITRIVGGDASRVVPVHDDEAWTRFPSRPSGDGLHVAEVTLARGEPSRLGYTESAAARNSP